MARLRRSVPEGWVVMVFRTLVLVPLFCLPPAAHAQDNLSQASLSLLLHPLPSPPPLPPLHLLPFPPPSPLCLLILLVPSCSSSPLLPPSLPFYLLLSPSISFSLLSPPSSPLPFLPPPLPLLLLLLLLARQHYRYFITG